MSDFFFRDADDSISTSVRLLSVTDNAGGYYQGRLVPHFSDQPLWWRRICVYSKHTLPRAPRISPRALRAPHPTDPAYVPSVSSPHGAGSPLSGAKGICQRSRYAPTLIEHAYALNALQNLYRPKGFYANRIQIVYTKIPEYAVIPR